MRSPRHLGTGLTGSLFNLPVIIYCEQAIFFAGGHAHGTMFGARGNIALASIRICCDLAAFFTGSHAHGSK